MPYFHIGYQLEIVNDVGVQLPGTKILMILGSILAAGVGSLVL